LISLHYFRKIARAEIAIKSYCTVPGFLEFLGYSLRMHLSQSCCVHMSKWKVCRQFCQLMVVFCYLYTTRVILNYLLFFLRLLIIFSTLWLLPLFIFSLILSIFNTSLSPLTSFLNLLILRLLILHIENWSFKFRIGMHF
jgi:hypothetical protein